MEEKSVLINNILEEINNLKLEILEKYDKLNQLKDIFNSINTNINVDSE